ncbi:MAG: helix-turn-helix domain-containing protein, partial [Desulfobulbales bacterium]
LNAFEKDSELPGAPEQNEFAAPSLARAEWEHIQRVLNDCDNNITAAAHKLGIHRRTLQRKLYKYAPKK